MNTNGKAIDTPTHVQKNEAQQPLHWTRLAAKNDSNYVTLLITPNQPIFLAPTLDPSQTRTLSHTSKLTQSLTKNQQSHRNYKSSLEHKVVSSIYYACTTPIDTLVNHNAKWAKLTYPPHHSNPRYLTDYQPTTMFTPQISTTTLLLHIRVIQTTSRKN